MLRKYFHPHAEIRPFAKLKPNPVFTTTPTIIPAAAVAAATANAVLAPSTKASIISLKFILVSLSIALNTTAATIPHNAACIVGTPINIKTIIVKIGINKYNFFNTSFRSGISSLDIPFNPTRFASKCVMIQIPAKYKNAGIAAALAISQ